MHLNGEDAGQSIALVKTCCSSVSDPFPDIIELLGDSNWRPHLVASVAIMISGYHSEAVRLLWRRVDTGSWVTPQLCATLSLINPEFLQQARSRLVSGCPLDATELREMDPAERHSAAGPAGILQRSSKAASALMCLSQMASPQPQWIHELHASADMQKLLEEDMDASDQIAEQWLSKVTTLLGPIEGS